MQKLILLSLFVGSYMFAGIHGDANNTKNQSSVEKYSWVIGSSEDDFKADAGRRRGKKNRGDRRRGGGGLR